MVPIVHVVIAGRHGKIALRLAALLLARGEVMTWLVRSPDHCAEVERVGAPASSYTWKRQTTPTSCHSSAGPTPSSSLRGAGQRRRPQERRRPRRRRAARRRRAGRGRARYLLVSSTGVDDPPLPEAVRADYLSAQKAAEEVVRASGLDWTILRPGRLTDDPGTGRVLLAPPPVERAT